MLDPSSEDHRLVAEGLLNLQIKICMSEIVVHLGSSQFHVAPSQCAHNYHLINKRIIIFFFGRLTHESTDDFLFAKVSSENELKVRSYISARPQNQGCGSD